MRYIILILLIISSRVFCQTDSLQRIYHLPEVEVAGEKSKNFSTGQRLFVADSISRANRATYTLAEQLQYGNTNFIRSYGNNGLSTLSLQGGSDIHSAVLWNGFNLQSVMNGTNDLSLYPTFFTDEVAVQTGGAAHLWGSGAVAGAVLLNNRPQFLKGLQIRNNTEIGSYNQIREQLKLGYSNQWWHASVKGFASKANNNYPYPISDESSRLLTHARTEQKGFLAENYFRWKTNYLAARLWIQDNYRETPDTEIDGTIYHDFKRGNIEFQKNLLKVQWHSRGAWLKENIFYLDPIRTENTKSVSNSYIGETEVRWNPSIRHHFNVGLNTTFQEAIIHTFNYGPITNLLAPDPLKYENGNPTRFIVALYAFYKYQSANNKLSTQISGRQEIVKGNKIPFVPSVGLEYIPMKFLLLKASASRSFRLPTFNELFWKPGGNKDLEPETGWNMEVSGRVTFEKSSFTLYYELAFYYRRMFDWVRWIPTGNYWSAQNVAEVHTQGVDNRVGAEIKVGKGIIKFLTSTAYVLAQNQRSALENDQSLGRQLIFIPMYQANGNVRFVYNGFCIEYNQQYVGFVYMASDHSQWLPPYHLGNAIISQLLPLKKLRIAAVFRVNNVWDAYYRTVRAYPMPPRHFTAGITIEFNQF